MNALPFGHGRWNVSIRNRFTGRTGIEFVDGYTAGFSWEYSGTSEASVELDRSKVRVLSGGAQIVPWRDELVFERLDEESPEAWAGPVTISADRPGGTYTIVASDRSVWPMKHRSWKRTGDLIGLDAAEAVGLAFSEASVGDPTGIEEVVVFPTGERIESQPVYEGALIGRTLDTLSVLAPWSVIGATVYVGKLEEDTALDLDADVWVDPTDAPTVTDDGGSILSRANLELRDGTIVSWPAYADVDFSRGGLVEGFFQVDTSPELALRLARAIVERSSHGLYVGGASGAFSEEFPLRLSDLRPGLLFGVRTENLGSLIETGNISQLSKVSVEIADGRETRVSGVFSPQLRDRLASIE